MRSAALAEWHSLPTTRLGTCNMWIVECRKIPNNAAESNPNHNPNTGPNPNAIPAIVTIMQILTTTPPHSASMFCIPHLASADIRVKGHCKK